MDKQAFVERATNWINKKPTSDVKSKFEGFEDPKSFLSRQTQEYVQPDFSFVTHGGAKHFTDIALKSENSRSLVTKWKLLSLIASMKRGKLHLLAPKGHKAYTEKLVQTHNINAIVYAI